MLSLTSVIEPEKLYVQPAAVARRTGPVNDPARRRKSEAIIPLEPLPARGFL